MAKILCIYPKDATIGFLDVVYQKICSIDGAIGLEGTPVEDDDYFDKLEKTLQDAQIVCFLGHGSSSTLYGPHDNPLICTDNDNVGLLQGKTLYLDACKSADYIAEHHLNSAIGFGFMPTSLDDVRNGILHKLKINELLDEDIDYFVKAKNNIWLKTIDSVGFESPKKFFSMFRFYTNKEIVDCLINGSTKHYRIVADMLYYLKEDMNFVCS